MKVFMFNNILVLAISLLISCDNEVKKGSAIESVSPASETIENSLGDKVQYDSIVANYNIIDRMKKYGIHGVSIAIVSNGKISWAKGYGIGNFDTLNKIDSNTLFQAASITKPITALAVLKLYEEGKIDLDQDINKYLKRWQLPVHEYTTTEKVTIRRILNHSAGISVSGFPGYMTHLKLPELIAILNGDGNTSPIEVKEIPGQRFSYSGGGYTILEMLIEDVSGQDFKTYMQNNILNPLGMNNSTYCQPIDTTVYRNISVGFDREGKMVLGRWHNHPELAAAGLWSTPTDIARYCIEIQEILGGKENGILKKQTIMEMLTPHYNNWGLGPVLRMVNAKLTFGHYGSNWGYKNNMNAFAFKGDAVIIMTNGENANLLIDEIERSVSSYYKWGINEYKVVR